MEKEPSQRQVKIDYGIWKELDKWLNSDDGKSQGYHSKAQFCTEAVNKLLVEKQTTNIKNITIINDNTIKLNDTQIPIDRDPRVTITLDDEFEWSCDYCKTNNCQHIEAVRISRPGFEIQKRKTEFIRKMQEEYEEEQIREAADIAGF